VGVATYKHLDYRKNDITDVLDETFTVTEDRFGEIVEVELRPAGANIPVTEENKKEYVEAVIEYRTRTRIREQSAAFLEGFKELIPSELIDVFDERELELLIGGMSEIDTYVPPFDLAVIAPVTNLGEQVMTGSRTRTTVVTRRRTRLSSGSGSASGVGHLSAKHVYCSSRLALREFL
jgi:hypothetical protein